MKKKLLIGAVVALFLGAGVFTATSLAAKEQISDLTLANIEAMAFNPDDPSATIDCDNTEKGICYTVIHRDMWGNTVSETKYFGQRITRH